MAQKKEKHRVVGNERLYTDVVAAIEHLHSLSLAHDDVNPQNILIASDGRGILADLGSIKPFGERLTERGTPPWNEGFGVDFDAEHDRIGLRKVRAWLELPDDS